LTEFFLPVTLSFMNTNLKTLHHHHRHLFADGACC